MRIGFFGGGRQALAGLNALHEHWNIALVCPRFMDDPVLSGFCHPNVVPVLDGKAVTASMAP